MGTEYHRNHNNKAVNQLFSSLEHLKRVSIEKEEGSYRFTLCRVDDGIHLVDGDDSTADERADGAGR